MSIIELFSKRQKKLRGEISDIFRYDEIPLALRVQVIHILNDSLGNNNDRNSVLDHVIEVYKIIVDILCREYGLFELISSHNYIRDYIAELRNYILTEKSPDKVLDAVELSFKAVDKWTRKHEYRYVKNFDKVADDSITELNQRFLEHNIGYQYASGKIIRIDSTYVHSEIILPSLILLSSKEYKGVEEEFLKAHEHYRKGNSKEAINEAYKAFESMMKVVCDLKKWNYPTNATAKSLIDILFQNDIINPFWNSHFSALRSLLESGIPTGRNKLGGHGQGAEPIEVPRYIAGFILNMTASCLLFLREALEFK